jgi:2-keto-3-deoxy-L-rhamnonate aldolase RhmA
MSERALGLKRRLREGATALGAWLSIADPAVAEIMAGVGFDYILIDTEHAPWSLESLQVSLMAFRGAPTVPIVRVPWNDQVHVKQALDVGADGVLAPMVRGAAEARALIAAAKYPPDGVRGFGPRRASDYGRNLDAYVENANAATIVIPQIEDIGSAEAVEELLAVPGLDALCIGPNDLSGSAGVLRQHDHPVVRAAIDRILRAAKAQGIPVCTGVTLTLERQREWIERGARLALLTSDVELLAGGAGAALAAARAALQR